MVNTAESVKNSSPPTVSTARTTWLVAVVYNVGAVVGCPVGGEGGGPVGGPVGGVVGGPVGGPVGGEVGGPVDCPVGGEVGTPRG
jgi:hypothetical protein